MERRGGSFKEGSFERWISFANNSSLCLISFLFYAGAGEMYYYVVLNGFHITEQKITSYTKNDKKLRVLAKKLAENLNINYFDVKANSREHVIRHRPVVEVRSINEGDITIAQPV